MKKLLKLLLIPFLLFLSFQVKATHVMGMDVTWKCLGNDTYEIKLVVYRRCTDGATSLSLNNSNLGGSPFSITSDSCANSYNVTGNIVPGSYVVDDITPLCPSQQSPCPGASTAQIPFGVERHTIKYKVYLGGVRANCCWYKIHWQLCCRNSNITTGYADADFYSESWMNRCVQPCDNGPEFKNTPVAIKCAGQDVCYNQGVLDIDGDSLSYSMAPPLGGTYSSPWSYTYPLTCLGNNNPNPNAVPMTGFNLFPDGTICFRPMQVQVTVLKIMVTEWRKDANGIYRVIGKTARDMQFAIIQNCNNKLPTLSGPFTYEACANQQICIIINTNDQDLSDTTKITWNKGIPNAIWSDNNGLVKRASGTLCWTPGDDDASTLPYYFTATVNDDHCPLMGSTSRSYSITVKPTPKNTRTFIKGKCGLWTFSATPSSSYFNGSSYKWYVPKLVGTGTPTVVYSSTQTTTYQFTQGGKYLVKSTMFFNGCTNTYFDTVNVDTTTQVKCIADSFFCYGKPITITSKIIGVKPILNYLWNTNDTTSTIIVNPSTSQYYRLRIMDVDSCVAIDSIFVKIDTNQKASVIFPLYPKKCWNSGFISLRAGLQVKNQPILTQTEKWYCVTIPDAVDTINFTFNTALVPSSGGKIWVTYEATSIEGCFGKDSIQLEIVPLPYVYAGVDKSFCVNYNTLFNLDTISVPFGGTWRIITNDYVSYPLDSVAAFGGKYTYRFSSTKAGDGVSHLGTTHTLVYTYKDILSPGCSNSDTVNFDVLPIPNADAGKDTSICVYSNPFNLTLTLGANYPNGKWYGTGVLPDSITFDPSINKTGNAQSYTLYYVVSVFGCMDFDSSVVTVNPIPNIKLSASKYFVCKNEQSIKLNGTPVDGQYYLDGTLCTSQIDPSILTSGFHAIKYIYTSPVGCVKDTSIQIYIEEPPIVTIDSVKSVCIEQARLSGITIKGHSNYGMLWIGNGTILSNVTDSIITYIPSQNEILNLKANLTLVSTGNVYCENDSVFIQIPLYPTPVVEFNIPVTKGCVPFTANFIDSSVVGNQASYYWDFGDPTSGLLNNDTNKVSTHTYNTTGLYTITLTVTSKEGCISTLIKSQLIEVVPLPKANFIFAPDSTDWATVANPRYKFTDASICNGCIINSWSWNFGDGMGYSTSQNPEYLYIVNDPDHDTGYYYINLQVTTKDGCTDYITKRVYIGPDITIFIPNAFSPDDNGSNEQFKAVATGIKTFQMFIFNRWGEKLYYSDNYKQHGWNGVFNELTSQNDVYIYKVIVTSKDDIKYEFDGTFHLIR